ncbi:hypothetical protein [Fictibacillus barbaricus]|uniref:Glycopeptide antibiotics resistance protein n=1 Tax=Fictibacillus barbaricus TaxID=182136 RepID=A0ABU1TX07_9BACL|nr:hypothetical protein [Fictibacillus barbaricus]MDR7071728.1 glycopeptide antibiotics resistance protein [Fictibacillus barbaricus]
MKYFGQGWLVILGGIILLFASASLFGDSTVMVPAIIIIYLCAVITGCTFMIVDAIKGINETKERKEQKSIKHLDY